jgi:hypothetical protein
VRLYTLGGPVSFLSPGFPRRSVVTPRGGLGTAPGFSNDGAPTFPVLLLGATVPLMARTPLREQIAAQEAEIEELRRAHEHAVSEYTLLSRKVEELAYIDVNNIVDATDEVLPQQKRVATLNRIRRLRHENPMAKQAIKLALRFVFGKGVSYNIRDKNTKRIIDSFWNDPVNQAVWTSHFMQVFNFDENLTQGEQFPLLFETPGEAPYVRIGVLPMDELTNIIYDPDNGRLPVWYRRVYRPKKWDPKLNDGEGGWASPKDPRPVTRYYRDYRISDEHLRDIESRGLVIPEKFIGEGKVKHRMVNPLWMRSGLRGMSELFASREWFRVFKEFMEDRGAINAAANALAYQRKILGGPVAVAGMTGKIGGISTGASDQPMLPSSFARRPLAGSLIDTNANVSITGIRADTGAPQAARDAEMLLTAAGAGTATPNHYFGGTNNALAGAQSVEVAVVKAFEDFQTYLRNDFRELTEYVISVALDTPVAELEEEDKEIAWGFPPIITQDIVKWVTGFAQWSQQVAPKNRVVREVAIRRTAEVLNVHDIEMIWEEIQEEEERIATLEDEQMEMQKQQQNMAAAAGVGKPPVPGNGAAPKNGNGQRPEGQKATTGVNIPGISPDDMRLTRGRPPREGATGPRSKRQ